MNINRIIFLQRKIKDYLIRRKKKNIRGKHRPHQSSVKLRSNRVSLTNFTTDLKSIYI